MACSGDLALRSAPPNYKDPPEMRFFWSPASATIATTLGSGLQLAGTVELESGIAGERVYRQQ